MALRYFSSLHKTCRQIAHAVEAHPAGAGANASEAHLLSYLRGYSPAPVSELHRVLGVKRSTLTSILDRLEGRRWVVRHHSRRDRRVILVHLTPAGRAQGDRIANTLEQLEADVRARVSDADLEGFKAVLAAAEAAIASFGRRAAADTGGAEVEKETA
jgi:DNA-binding MarR family transcriptional regulator